MEASKPKEVTMAHAPHPQVPEEQQEAIEALKKMFESQKTANPKIVDALKELKVSSKDGAHPNLICRFDWTCWLV
jgi:hypothetical protein